MDTQRIPDFFGFDPRAHDTRANADAVDQTGTSARSRSAVTASAG